MRYAIILLLWLPLAGFAQYANDWVRPGQQYLKISVAENAVYRITYSDLANAGLPVSSIDPRLIQVFHRGTEQAIRFNHNQVPADHNFDPTEYLEFYGQRNDGTLDRELYLPSTAQPHPYYNLYSDTSAYFLTWNQAPVQGKRMEVFDQVNSANLPREGAQTRELLSLYTTEYSPGLTLLNTITQSFFTEGEGWTGSQICTPNCATDYRDFTISQITNIAAAAGTPQFEVMVAGREPLLHKVELYAGPNAGSLRLVTSVSFSEFQVGLMSGNLNWTDVSMTGNLLLRIRAVGVGGDRDRVSVSYIRVSYPADFNMAGVAQTTMKLAANAAGKSYVELSNAAAGARLFDITDPSNIVVIGTRTSGPVVSAVIPNTLSPRKILYHTASKSVQPSQLTTVTFRDLERDADFIIISHPSLTASGGGYGNPVEAYAAYRESPEGGSYRTLTVMMDELYDQFNYGERSARAIREFVRMLTGIGDPKYLFIIGKGRELTAQYHRRSPFPGELPDLVPTGGSPASDAVFSMGFSGDTFVPAIPTGRLPATTPGHVAAYLNKIKETEASPDHNWQKRVLHLSGGIQPNELATFKTYVHGFGEIAKKKFLGADVRTLGKHSTATVEFINISKEVNEGVNLVTFFGHSSSNATDIDIGKVTDPLLIFSNKGKYPVLLVNGCYAGEFFNNGVNFGEDWILAADKGARNFMANSSFGLDGFLKLYTDQFYESGFGDSILINKGAGDAQVAVAKKMLTGVSEPNFNSAQVHQMVLLGDPSVKLLEVRAPDFTIDDASITVSAWDDKPIHALSDSLKITVIVKNPGKVSSAPLRVRILHTLGDVEHKIDTLFSSLLNTDTLSVTLPRHNGNFFGSNTIEVMLDPLNEVAELNESNNSATWTKNIVFNGTQNLQPAPFGIVGTGPVELVFMNTDMMSHEQTYTLEVDTVASFNSPYKLTRSVTAKVLGRTSLTLLSNDSLVYYWRTRPSVATDVQWETTSFTFIQGGGPGFAQLNFDQLLANSLDGLVADPVLEKLEFEETSVSFFVRTFGGAHPLSQVNGSFQVNDAEYYHSPQQFDCRNNTINLVAFDRSSVVPYLGIPFTFQNSFGRSCGREPMLINSFTAAEVETGNSDDLIKYVDNIKEGDSVVLFSMGNAGFSSWSSAVVQKLGELGIIQADVDEFVDGEPVIILGKKGASPGTATIIRSDGSQPEEDELQLTEGFRGRVPNGSIKSVLIGPALKWKDAAPRISGVGLSDIAFVDAIGVSRDRHEVISISGQVQAFDLGSVDAAQHPYLKLQFKTQDEVTLSPSRLDQWIVNFDPAPDGMVVAITPGKPVRLQEGNVLQARFGFVNITDVPFSDSLQAVLTVRNQTKGISERHTLKIKGPAPGDTTYVDFDIATRSKLGFNDLTLSINNGIVTEQYLQNNVLELPGYLEVRKDNINPLLDVTIDGRYLVNGDLVSANPDIDITLMDENHLLGRLDTTLLALFLTYPCASGDCPATRISFSRDDVTWTSASSSPELRVEFKPKDLADGLYELRIQGFDVSGNPSGTEPYLVSFEVRGQPDITHVPPYPNPSHGPFFFEFLSAGDHPPDAMLLQIFTREGREVARFDEADAPPLHIGLNQFQSTGLDAHGGRLSSGLYMFRLTVHQAGVNYTTSGRLVVIN